MARTDGEKADEFGDHAMAVLELHASDHVGHFVEGTEGGGPVRYGKACVVTGDKRACHNQ